MGNIIKFLKHSRKLSNFHHWECSNYRFVKYGLHCYEVHSFYTQLIEYFYYERILNFIIWLSAYIEIIMILIFYSINVVYRIYWFALMNPLASQWQFTCYGVWSFLYAVKFWWLMFYRENFSSIFRILSWSFLFMFSCSVWLW